MLFVCTWRWGSKWGGNYAARLLAGLRRNIKQEFRAVLITDCDGHKGFDIICPIAKGDRPLLAKRGCLVRMRMFDRVWQDSIGAKLGDRIVNMDLDTVLTGPLDPLFDRDDDFTIMQGFNTTNPCPFQGSLWMLRAGVRHDVFDDFSFATYLKRKIPFHAFPDDQGWLHHKFLNAAAWTAQDGAYAFKKKNWPAVSKAITHGLPDNARVVAFPGRDPNDYKWLGWVRQHWMGESALITADYARQNAALHAVDPKFGAEGYLWAYLVAGIAHLENCTSILDYGCGKGSLAKALKSSGFLVTEYDPGFPGKTELPQPADLVACLDALEHIEPDYLGDVINHLAHCANKKLFVVISTKLSKRLLPDGRDTHLSLHDDDWWRLKFTSHGFKIDRVWYTGLRLWVALLSPPRKS